MWSTETAKTVSAFAICLTGYAWGGAPPESAGTAVRDAWADGRIETAFALNPQLCTLEIGTEVENGVVHLSGNVDTAINRDLAIEIATAIEGVRKVDSSLRVAGARAPVYGAVEGEPRSFGQWIADLTASARVRTNLIANGNTRDLPIDVNTENDVVTLKGAVSSRKEKMLVEMIARNTDGIASVRNQIEINEPS